MPVFTGFRMGPVLVVADDVALPPGIIRLRREGGSGGQKGLESVLVHFATEQVPRLRVGVGGASSGLTLRVMSSPGSVRWKFP